MKLRTRLVLTTLLVAIPVVAAFVWMEQRSRHHLVESSMTSSVLGYLGPEQLADCNANPQSWSARLVPHAPLAGRHMRPVTGATHLPMGMLVYAYDSNFRRLNPAAPELDPMLIERLENGDSVASQPTVYQKRAGYEALLRLPVSGRCRYVLATRPVPPIMVGGPFDQRGFLTWLLPALTIIAAVALAMGTVVRRVRRLTAQVRATSKDAYAQLPAARGDDEIAELHQAFFEAGREIRSQMQAQKLKEDALREFLSNTTHDVMIPLTVLQGHLSEYSRLTEATEQPPDRNRQDALAGALQEAHYIGALLRNLSLAARLDSGLPSLHIAPVDLRELVERIALRHSLIARQQGIELVHSVPSEALITCADGLMLEQALGNVVFNAIVHNRVGGHVALLLEAERDGFTLRVLDDGPGVSDAELPRLTERHFQSNTARTRRRSGGLGLGLHITQRVFDSHGWKIAFARSEYGGLAFSVTAHRDAEPCPPTPVAMG